MRPSHSAVQSQSLLALISALSAVLAQLDLSQYASQPRWAQASITLSENAWLVYGGKVSANGGYTYSSAPDTNDLLYLPLNSPFPAASPPWQYLAGSQIPSTAPQPPPVSYAALGLLDTPTPSSSSGTILAFGGDAPASPNLTNSDSAWLISLATLPSTQANSSLITQQPSSWAQQPIRRIRHTLNSASNPDSIRIWVLGGQHADGSQTALNELWQYSASQASPQLGLWSACPPAPQALFDHASVAILDSNNIVRLYAFGGLDADGQPVPTNTLYRFTPDLTSSNLCAGVWDTINIPGDSRPSGRRGHSAVSLSSSQFLVFGGASATASTVFSDLWTLDLDRLNWTLLKVPGGPSGRWGQSMTRVGQRVLIAFGYGPIDSSRPSPAGAAVLDLNSLKWVDSYSLSDTTSLDASSSVGASSTAAGVPLPGQAVSSTSAPGADPATSTNAQGWQVTGFRHPVKNLPLPQPNNPSNDTDSHSPRINTIIGITVAVIGALILAGGSVYLHRYNKQQNIARRLKAEEYRRRAYGPDLPMDDDDDQSGLVQNESLHANHASAVPGGWRPGGLKALASVGAFWAPYRPRKQRFDMLADEESEIWSAHADHPGVFSGRRQRQYLDGFADRVRLPPPVPLPMGETNQNDATLPLVTTRGGLRIWRGLDDSSSQIGFGTSTSFLGASLAPWSDDGRSPSIPEVTRFEDPFDDGHAASYQDQQGSSTDSSRSDPNNPFGDPEEEEEQEEVHSEHTALTSHSAHPDSSSSGPCITTGPTTPSNYQLLPAPMPLERRGTWWERLRDKHVFLEQMTHPQPIRDPAPPPLIPPPISEVHVVDEHGRRGTEPEKSATIQQDTKGSHRTATSSMIEAAAEHMTVVQRLGSIDSGNPVLETCETFVSRGLVGPRALEVLPKKKQTAGAVGVRAMIEAFETTKEAVNEIETSKRAKVVHGLVKKPVLFVANPDKQLSP